MILAGVLAVLVLVYVGVQKGVSSQPEAVTEESGSYPLTSHTAEELTSLPVIYVYAVVITLFKVYLALYQLIYHNLFNFIGMRAPAGDKYIAVNYGYNANAGGGTPVKRLTVGFKHPKQHTQYYKT